MARRRRSSQRVVPTTLMEIFAALPPMSEYGLLTPEQERLRLSAILYLSSRRPEGYVSEPHVVSEPERRHEQVSAKPMEMSSNVMLETGQQQERQASNLLFYCYVTPTGVEISLGKCPHLKRVWGQSEGGFEGSTRIQRTEYQVTAPVTIKMVNICTRFGDEKRMVNLFIDLDPNVAAVEFTGLEGFGLFKGRGKVNFKKSSYKENKQVHAVNDAMLKDLFSIKVLQPPRVQGKAKVRSLIF